ncbi:hypothetical protein [Actinomadura vinacea]|uniref:hypothetical protein n=1 Tax=Actinomadura vinacea TaxID=115336 RepID=UPI0031D5E8B2
MPEPHPRTPEAQHRHGSPRRFHRRWTLIILVKAALIALVLALPAQPAISVGAAHAVVVLLVGGGIAALFLSRRQGPARRPPHEH